MRVQLRVKGIFFVQVTNAFGVGGTQKVLLFGPFVRFFQGFATRTFITRTPTRGTNTIFVTIVGHLCTLRTHLFPFKTQAQGLQTTSCTQTIYTITLRVVFVGGVGTMFVTGLGPTRTIKVI